jgi:UrcA family protein
MDKKNSTRRKMRLVILSVAALVGAAMASESAIAQKDVEIIIVTAPREVHKVVGRSPSGVPVEEISISYEVGIADLDLTTSSGLAELETRIGNAAKLACWALNKVTPLIPTDPSCVTKAIASAADQKKQAITVAVPK